MPRRAVLASGLAFALCGAVLADGRQEISLDGVLDAFDYCALTPIVRNAGGAITDWEGRELTIHSGHRCVVASGSPALHETVLDRLRCHR